MISRLRGAPVARVGERLVLDVGGVGYALAVTPTAARLAERGGEVTLETYLHVREDALQLYGFASAEERDLFVHLLSVNGVGPKVALAIVAGSPPGELTRAIAREDTARFEAIPGIASKRAVSSSAIARRRSAGGEPETIASATFGPTPETASRCSNSSRSAGSPNP